MSLTALEETDIYTYKKIVKFLNEKNNWKKFPHHRACVASWENQKVRKEKTIKQKNKQTVFWKTRMKQKISNIEKTKN